MFSEDPNLRLNIADILSHPWMMGETATLEQCSREFARRKAIIDKEKVDELQRVVGFPEYNEEAERYKV